MPRVWAAQTIVEFFGQTRPIHYFWSKTHILGSFAPFGCRKCTVPKSDPRMPFWHEFRPMKLFSRFSTKTLPIHYVRSETHVLGGFAPFGSSKCRLAKSGPGMPFWHEFGLTKLLSSFWPKRIQSTTLGPKLTFWVVSHHLVPAKVQLCQIGSWDAVWSRVWADETIVEFFSQNSSNPLL